MGNPFLVEQEQPSRAPGSLPCLSVPASSVSASPAALGAVAASCLLTSVWFKCAPPWWPASGSRLPACLQDIFFPRHLLRLLPLFVPSARSSSPWSRGLQRTELPCPSLSQQVFLLPRTSFSLGCQSLQFTRSVVSDSLRPHELQHARASLSITNSRSPPKPMSTESVMPSSHLILCRPRLLLPSVFPSSRVLSSESALCVRWPKYWSFSFSISPSSEDSGLISFRMDWFRICGPCPLPAWFTEGFYCGMLRVHIFRTLVVCQKYLSGRFMSRSSSF